MVRAHVVNPGVAHVDVVARLAHLGLHLPSPRAVEAFRRRFVQPYTSGVNFHTQYAERRLNDTTVRGDLQAHLPADGQALRVQADGEERVRVVGERPVRLAARNECCIRPAQIKCELAA